MSSPPPTHLYLLGAEPGANPPGITRSRYSRWVNRVSSQVRQDVCREEVTSGKRQKKVSVRAAQRVADSLRKRTENFFAGKRSRKPKVSQATDMDMDAEDVSPSDPLNLQDLANVSPFMAPKLPANHEAADGFNLDDEAKTGILAPWPKAIFKGPAIAADTLFEQQLEEYMAAKISPAATDNMDSSDSFSNRASV